MTALMLTAMIAVGLGLWGPMKISYDTAKDFQPLIAAMVALSAAIIAFRAAMAKVNLDRENAERDRTTRKLGLFLRLRATINRLRSDAIVAKENIRGLLDDELAPRKAFPWSFLSLSDRTELDEAWEKLDLLPSATIQAFNDFRSQVIALKSTLNQIVEKKGKQISDDVRSELLLVHYAEGCKAVESLGVGLLVALDAEIKQITTASTR